MTFSESFADPRLVKSFNEQGRVPGYSVAEHGSVLVIIAAGHAWAIRHPTWRLDLLWPKLRSLGIDPHCPLSIETAHELFQRIAAALQQANQKALERQLANSINKAEKHG